MTNKKTPKRKCSMCGTDNEDDNVERIFDPYDDEINQHLVKRNLCDGCYDKRVTQVQEELEIAKEYTLDETDE